MNESNEEIKWFQDDILNLSDVLRDPLIDYELITDSDSGPNHGLTHTRFFVGNIVNNLIERSNNLLNSAKNANFTEFEMRILESELYQKAD